jgi:hypothetical protein
MNDIYNVLKLYTFHDLNKLICAHITHTITLSYANDKNTQILISNNTIYNILNNVYTIEPYTTGYNIVISFTTQYVKLYMKYGSTIEISFKGIYTSIQHIKTDYIIGLTKGTMHFALQKELLTIPYNVNINNINNMTNMFFDATSFNCDLNHWNVNHVTNMMNMFSGAKSFDGKISNWDVSNVENMFGMFYNAKSFNGDLSSWNINKVKRMDLMFSNASGFMCLYPVGNLNNWANIKSIKTNMFSFANKDIKKIIGKWNNNNTELGISEVEAPGGPVIF